MKLSYRTTVRRTERFHLYFRKRSVHNPCVVADQPASVFPQILHYFLYFIVCPHIVLVRQKNIVAPAGRKRRVDILFDPKSRSLQQPDRNFPVLIFSDQLTRPVRRTVVRYDNFIAAGQVPYDRIPLLLGLTGKSAWMPRFTGPRSREISPL